MGLVGFGVSPVESTCVCLIRGHACHSRYTQGQNAHQDAEEAGVGQPVPISPQPAAPGHAPVLLPLLLLLLPFVVFDVRTRAGPRPVACVCARASVDLSDVHRSTKHQLPISTKPFKVLTVCPVAERRRGRRARRRRCSSRGLPGTLYWAGEKKAAAHGESDQRRNV